jgi:hypothetical protein
MAKLSRSASGLRHLRWGREILGTLRAHVEKNPELSEEKRNQLRAEIAALVGLVDGLSAAVKPYRDFLERTRTGFRGQQRVAAYLGDEAMGNEASRAAESLRRPLKVALEQAITSLRAGLEQMDVRLGERFVERFVESLYPGLSRGNTFIADDDDQDDDATAPRDEIG